MAAQVFYEKTLNNISQRTGGIPYETLRQYKFNLLRCCEKKKLKEIYLCGIPFLEIGIYFGISVPMVRSWITYYLPNLPKRSHVTPRTHNYYKPEMQPDLERMYINGDSVERMSTHFGVSKVSIRNWIRKYLSHIPPRAKYHKEGIKIHIELPAEPSPEPSPDELKYPSPAVYEKYQRIHEQQIQSILTEHGSQIFSKVAKSLLSIWREIEDQSGKSYLHAVEERICERCGISSETWWTLRISDELESAIYAAIRAN